MKKIALLLFSLSGLGLTPQLFAQTDLDVYNNTSCNMTVDFSYVDNCCNVHTITGASIGPGWNYLFCNIHVCSNVEVFSVTVYSLTTVTVGDPNTVCNNSGSTPKSIKECGSTFVNVTYTAPTSTTNAIVTIN